MYQQLTIVLMVIVVVIKKVMSNIALIAILVPLSVTLATVQGQPIGIHAFPVAITCRLSYLNIYSIMINH